MENIPVIIDPTDELMEQAVRRQHKLTVRTKTPISSIKTNTRMSLRHLHDFYVLQDIEASISREMAAHPEYQFSKSVEKFQKTLDEITFDLYANMAQRIFVYLYAACYGEARHALSDQAATHFLQSSQSSRLTMFREIVNYAPTQDNLQAMVGVFAQNWKSGFGGEAWCNIARALLDYDKLPPAAFIDHVVDLEHNNGTAFSKNDGRDCLAFDVSYPGRFRSFLDFKFRDSLIERYFVPSNDPYFFVSRKVYYVLRKYCVVFGKKMPSWFRPQLDTLGEYEVQWGDMKLELVEKWAQWMNVSTGNQPSASLLYENCGVDSMYVSGHTKKELEAHIKKSIKTARKMAGKYWTKELRTRFMRKVAEFERWAFKFCKPEKTPVTYSVLPVKVGQTTQLIVQCNLPFQGIGAKRDYGFEVVVGNYGVKLPNTTQPGYGRWNGFLDAVLFHRGDDTILSIDNNGTTLEFFLNNTILEALLD